MDLTLPTTPRQIFRKIENTKLYCVSTRANLFCFPRPTAAYPYLPNALAEVHCRRHRCKE
ncbi:hypothetical protein M5D96_001214 [Drosophila gunungcola]|uniref:Uncharacterized protein n=1 Tax=Drosophila gunungcola TaxID=103775 RepID=A0A9Q0BUH3_9MUSC|nr:hypothetical protein M5D96_001214 [Drosophila gunungcola]